MFSIIVPYYNMANYINKTLKSLAEQTCKDFEVIIVDDGSDAPLEAIKYSTELNYRIIRTVNQGVSVARNTGAALANYEYLLFLDAGDAYDSRFLEKIQAAVSSSKHALYATSFAFSRGKEHDTVDTGLTQPNCVFSYKNYLEHLCKGLYLFHICSLAISKQLFFSVGGFTPKATHGEDHEFILKCLKAKDALYFINLGLFHYSLDDESSATRSKKYQPIYAHAYWLKTFKRSYIEDQYLAYVMLDFLIVNLKKGFVTQSFLKLIQFMPVQFYRSLFAQLFNRYSRYAKK